MRLGVLFAWTLLAGCSVEVESRLRLCTASSPCAEGRACVDGYCVSPEQRVNPEGPCEATALLERLERPELNLVKNGDFDQDLIGWNTINAELSRVPSTLRAGFAVRVKSTDISNEYALNDSPSYLRDPTTGTRYCWAAWVRSDSATSEVQLDVKEYSASDARVGDSVTQVALSPTWQRLRVEYVAVGSPGGFLDLHVRVQEPQTAGESFDVDHAALWVAP